MSHRRPERRAPGSHSPIGREASSLSVKPARPMPHEHPAATEPSGVHASFFRPPLMYGIAKQTGIR